VNFLFPQFLFGLFALSIPIIIHLFSFRRTKKIYFSSTQFLKNVKEASKSKLKLKHLLILAARLLFIVFLVMAFAQPIKEANNEGLNSDKVLIYLDNSFSMSNEVNVDFAALDEGIKYVNEIINLYPPGTQYLLLTNDFAPFSNSYKSKAEIEELTTELDYSGMTRSFGEIAQRISTENLFTGVNKKDVFIISDFQKSTLGNPVALASDSLSNIHLIPLFFMASANVLIDSVYLETPFIMVNEKTVLNAEVRNNGKSEINDLLLKVIINEVQVANASVNIKPKSKETVKFDLGFNLEEISRCRISFEEYPVTFDNDFYFTINRSDKISVLEIKSGTDTTVVENVFANTALFEFNSYPVGNLDYNVISSSDLVILNGLNQINPSLGVAINQYLSRLGNVVLIPGPLPDQESYNVIVKSRVISKKDTLVKSSLATPDFNNPFFENVFENRSSNFAMPEAAPIISWGNDRDAILKFRNEQPFLSKLKGSGFIFLFTTPFEDDFTNFHRHAIFVPVMYKIAATSMTKSAKLYYDFNQPLIQVKIDSIGKDQIFKMTREDQEIIPSQRTNGNELLLEIPKHTLKAGFYDLKFQDQAKTVLSFNYGASESSLDQYTPDEIKDNLSGSKNISIFNVKNSSELTKEIKENYLGVPLWKYALILAMIFLMAEILLIRFL